MNHLTLSYRYDESFGGGHGLDGIDRPGRDDFGLLTLSVDSGDFSGTGSFLVQWQNVLAFGKRLDVFPIPPPGQRLVGPLDRGRLVRRYPRRRDRRREPHRRPAGERRDRRRRCAGATVDDVRDPLPGRRGLLPRHPRSDGAQARPGGPPWQLTRDLHAASAGRRASTLSMRRPSRSTTSKHQPCSVTCSPGTGRCPSSSMIIPASVA